MINISAWRRVVAAGVLSLSPVLAHSATVICAGKVTALSYHSPGVLYVQLEGMNTGVAICSVDTNWSPPGSLYGATTPAACKTIYASLLVAKQSGTPLLTAYFDGDTVPANCNQFAGWTQANFRFFSF